MLAAKYSHVEVCAILMKFPEAGPAYLNQQDKNPLSMKTALHYAANYGQTSAAMFLLRIGASKLILDADGNHPGKTALVAGYFPTAQMILGYNPPPIDVTPVFNYLTGDNDKSALDVISGALGTVANTVSNMFGTLTGAVESAVGTKYSAKVVTKKKAVNDAVWDKTNDTKPSTGSADMVRPFTIEE